MENLSNFGTFVKLSSKAIRKVLHDFADFDEKTRNLILKNKKNKFTLIAFATFKKVLIFGGNFNPKKRETWL